MLSNRLSAYLADEIRFRLDRIFLEICQCPENSSSACSEDGAQLEQSLKAELDTLYTEITAVAQMSTSLEFENLSIEALKQNSVQNNIYISTALKHVCCM